ncbi:MAG: hypothetical protein ABSB70_22850 [Candidatus Velthaea sp.]
MVPAERGIAEPSRGRQRLHFFLLDDGKFGMKILRLLPPVALAAICLGGSAASAADTMMAAPDCATANATMMKMAAMPMPAMSGTDLDKNFMASMHAMSAHGMKMAQLEAACGKDPQAKAAAEKMVLDMKEEQKLLEGGH